MARVSTLSDAAPEEVFAVLANGWRYPEWVVGNKRIRAVDDDWPTPGSRFHHVVGVGPASFHDYSEVLEVEANRRILLEVRVWPAGRGHVEVVLEPADGGTRIVLDEVPVDGPAKSFDSPVLEAMTRLRNTESVRRLRRSAEEERKVRRG